MERDEFFSEVTSIQYLTGHREKLSNFIIVFPTRILKKVKISTFFFYFFFGSDFLFLKNKKKTLCAPLGIWMVFSKIQTDFKSTEPSKLWSAARPQKLRYEIFDVKVLTILFYSQFIYILLFKKLLYTIKIVCSMPFRLVFVSLRSVQQF